MKNKAVYIIGIILVLGLLAYAVIKINPHDNNLKSENSQIYSDNKINFSIPSELEQYKTSFGSDDGIILSKFENNSVLISITIVSSSTNNLEYVWAENCGYKTSCGHEKYSLDYFNLQYDTITKLHPNLLDQSTSIFKDKSNQNFYEKGVLVNEKLVFGTVVVFDAESQNLARIVYYYPSNLDNEFEGYKNTILESLKFN